MNKEEEVNTLEHLEDDNKNTETEDINNESTENITTDKDEISSNDDNIDLNTLESLSDEQFEEYFETGKLPKEFEVNKPLGESVKKEEQTSVKKEDTPKEDNTKTSSEQKEIDYKSIYNNIFSGFKANGKEIKPKTVEDVVSLMQQGANYTKKMQVMAPMRKTIESLNKANITEKDLNFLIDIHNGDKEAIKNLLKKHKVDPIELDMDSTNYVPKNNIISDEDAEYSDTLDDIQNSLPKIQEIINKQWDGKSKELLLKHPNLMRALHEEIELGRFDSIQSQLEQEKIFGRYKNKSDIEAYIDLVTKIVEEQQNKQLTSPTKPTNTPKKDIPDKKGAAPNKAAKVSTQGSNLTSKDIFSMSEEEFSKLSINDLI